MAAVIDHLIHNLGAKRGQYGHNTVRLISVYSECNLLDVAAVLLTKLSGKIFNNDLSFLGLKRSY